MQANTAIDFAADCVAFADFDFDGLPEYVAGRGTSPELLVYNVEAGEPALRARIALDSLPVALGHGDFDLDDVPELAVALIDARLAIFDSDAALHFCLLRTLNLSSAPRDLDVSLVGGHLLLAVATASGIETVDPIESHPESPPVRECVAEATERLEELARDTSFDAVLSNAWLTHREREVMSLTLRGVRAREIGHRLFIGERTVETHVAHAYAKLGVSSRFELLIRLSSKN